MKEIKKDFINPNKPKLRFKTKQKSKKILILGIDGSGKSQFAQKYCDDHNLKPAVLDFDNTNYSSENIIEFQPERTPKKTAEKYCEIIKEISKSTDLNTLIIDNVIAFFETLMGNSEGWSKYGERKQNWLKVKQCLLNSNINVIFIGQMDAEISNDPENKTSGVIVSVHALSNEKYRCNHENHEFSQIVLKYREHAEYIGKKYDEIKGE